MSFRPLLRLAALTLVIMLSLSAFSPARAGDLFTYQCNTGGLVILLHGTAVLQAEFTQITRALSIARASQQNVPVVLGNPASLWALKSNELQIHLNSDPDGTKLVLSADICGQSIPVTNNFDGQALAYVQLFGPGIAVAYAHVTASGDTVAYAAVAGQGQALAYAQSNVTSGSGGGSSGGYYIVQPGDDLYRIAIRFNTTVDWLVQANGLSDANLIVVGQRLRVPD